MNMKAKAMIVTGLLALVALLPAAGVRAQDDQIDAIRGATEPYRQVEGATAAGYAANFGCVTHMGHGAMGIHYINGDLLADPAIDPLRPEAVMYEPQADGTLQAVGIEYVVLQEAWHAAGNQAPPTVAGQPFYLTTGFFDVPPFYALHIWLWKDNPAGTFAGYNPDVVCPEDQATFPNAVSVLAAPRALPDTGGEVGPLLVAPALLALGLLAVGAFLARRALARV
jgi:hypothetical protein